MRRKTSERAAAAQLAQALKRWRTHAHRPAKTAAEMLGLSCRTLEGIEQGRGFRHWRLLILALEAFRRNAL